MATSSSSAPSAPPKPPSPTSITLAPYSLRYRQRWTSDFLPFCDPDFGDLYNAIFDCLDRLGAQHEVDKTDQQVIKVRRLAANRQQRWMEGWLEAGTYGWESDLRDVDTFRHHYHRQRQDVEILPFYFLFYLPEKTSHGVLILERFGVHGVKTALEQALVSCLTKKVTLKLDPLVPEAFIEHLRKAKRIRKIRLWRTQVPTNIAQAFHLGGVEDVSSELVIHLGKDSPVPQVLRRILGRGRKAKGYAAVQREFPFDRMKMEVEVEGRVRTLDVQNPASLIARRDVTELVDLEGAHPTWDSIRREVFRLLSEIWGSTYQLPGVSGKGSDAGAAPAATETRKYPVADAVELKRKTA